MTGSFNTQPPASRPRPAQTRFNTQPTHPAHVFLIQFQHTAARRRLGGWLVIVIVGFRFQHTAARRRLEINQFKHLSINTFQHTAARRRLARMNSARKSGRLFQHTAARRRLASVPAGAWLVKPFQHTAARRRLGGGMGVAAIFIFVSTHSRPKAAGVSSSSPTAAASGFNTQPPEGGWAGATQSRRHRLVSTHSRPKAAGIAICGGSSCLSEFQHTAARRRLLFASGFLLVRLPVSTHSRPKAAAVCQRFFIGEATCFNTQPPEGGCRLGRRAESLR